MAKSDKKVPFGSAMMGKVYPKASAAGNQAEYTKARPPTKRTSGGGRMSHASIEVADNGGFTVTCSYDQPGEPGPYKRPVKHVFGNKAAMISYITKAF